MLPETNQSVEDLPRYETTHYVPVDQKGAPYHNVEKVITNPDDDRVGERVSAGDACSTGLCLNLSDGFT